MAARIADFGSGGTLVFPSSSDAFNAVTLHPRLLAAIGQLLGVATTELRLTQADLWPKYGHTRTPAALDNDEQRMHVDYPNHTLVHPGPWARPEAVELILYLERPKLAAWRQRLYAREQQVHYAPGDVLFYRHDLWHRGTPLIPGRMRVVQNITYRRAAAEWISTLHVGWAWSAYQPSKVFERLIAMASLEQRAVLGFPQPGSDYWCPETIAAVEARYGMYGIDMTPYRAS